MRPRLLIFIPAYNAEQHIESVIDRIPRDLRTEFDPAVLIIDDASQDGTARVAVQALERSPLDVPWEVLANPRNLGYGGNQKLGYRYAIRHGFDVVVMVHGDGQYPPEDVAPLARAALEHGAAFGSRFASRGGARKGGMPLYKYVGNRILTTMQNGLLSTSLTEFHSGFRAYATATLREIPFDLCADDFHFDTEIFIQCIRSGVDIGELAIPTRYADEVCHVDGLNYAWNVLGQSLRSKLQDVGLAYERKYDVHPPEDPYESKIGFDSPSEYVLERVSGTPRVVDFGSSAGYVAQQLSARGATVICVDREVPRAWTGGEITFVKGNLDEGIPDIEGDVDVVLLLDVIEHLSAPEKFVAELARFCREHGVRELYASTGNVAFLPQRAMLMLGQFNYGPRGILDMTHTRLFTSSSFRRLWKQSGFAVLEHVGVPAPFPLAVGDGRVSRALLSANRVLIRLRKSLFAYQIFLRLRPPVNLDSLIDASRDQAGRLSHDSPTASHGTAGAGGPSVESP